MKKAANKVSNVEAVLTERGERYGDFQQHAWLSQALKQKLSERDGYQFLEPFQQEAVDVICTNLAGVIIGDGKSATSWAEIAAYSKMVSEVLEGVER